MSIKFSPPTWKAISSSLVLFAIGLILGFLMGQEKTGLALVGLGYIDLLVGVWIKGW